MGFEIVINTMVNDDKKEYLEIYKIYLDGIYLNETKRMKSNQFYSALYLALLAVYEAFDLDGSIYIIGITIISFIWVVSIYSYRKMANVKWEVCNDIESQLITQPFQDEYKKMSDNINKSYIQYTKIEILVPIVLLLASYLYALYIYFANMN